MKCRKIIQSLISALALLIACGSVTAFASDGNTVDFSKTGVISVTLKTEDTQVSGAELTVYRVADAVSKNNNLAFAYTEAFAGFGGAPKRLKSEQDGKRLAEYVKENGVSGTAAVTDSSGYAAFEDLPLGLYLVTQTQSVEGFSDCSPFLVSLPAEEDGKWVYETDATPKTDVEQLVDLTVTKVWNDGKDKDRPNSVTVQLLKDGDVLDTVTLNESGSWEYTWQALPKSDEYEVKEKSVPKGYTATCRQDGYDFTVTNSTKLAQTGQLNWPIPALAVCGLALLTAGGFLMRRKKDRA